MLFSLLQLLQMEQKTCALKIKSQHRKGTLYFSRGDLIDAVYEQKTGEEAAQIIVCWEEAEIEIVNVFKKMRRRILKPLQNLLMDAAKEKDEAALKGEPRSSEIEKAAVEKVITPEPSKEIFVPKRASPLDEIPAPAHVADGLNPKNVGNEFSDNNSNNKNKEHKINMANNIEQSLNELMTIDGAMAVALVDIESGMALGTAGSGVNLEVAAAGNSEVVNCKQKVMQNLGLKDKIEDILISLGAQYHLIRPLKTHGNLFIYLILGREKSNLAMARFKLSDIENRVEV
jgi:hypothetical protein